MTAIASDLLSEVRAFRAAHPDVQYVDLIGLDLPGHFYGKRYPIGMLEKVAAGAMLKLPQNTILLGAQGGVYPIGDYCFHDGGPFDSRAIFRLARAMPGEALPFGPL